MGKTLWKCVALPGFNPTGVKGNPRKLYCCSRDSSPYSAARLAFVNTPPRLMGNAPLDIEIIR
jgi:hypothetical protein